MQVADIGAGQDALGGQHQNDRRDHDLVGNRIEKHPQPGDRSLGAGNIAVEIVGDPHQAIDRKSQAIAQFPIRPPQQRDQNGHRDDARQGEEIGQGQHCA